MSVLISDLVRDLQITLAACDEANARLREAQARLLDGLALIGTPLNVNGTVVIGNLMLKRPYATLPLEVETVANVPCDTVVIDDSVPVAVSPYTDLPL